MSRPIVVFCTVPTDEVSRSLATALVERRLAAGVNVVPGVRSTFRWKGEIRSSAEELLLIKTTRDRWPDLEAAILELHPYDVPQILAVEPAEGTAEYLRWIVESTS